VGIPLLYFGFEFFGVVLGLIVASVVSDALIIFYAARILRGFKVKFGVHLPHLKDLLEAGLPSWVPSVLAILGISAGVLGVYDVVGGTGTGLYYIAFAISMIVYSISSSILGLMFPVLSSMEDGRKRAVSRIMGLALAVTVPLASALAIYPYLPLSLLGPGYIEASTILTILALGAIISPIIMGYQSYVYAIGKYLHVTLMGLAANVGMLILYVLLIPSFDGVGAATAYTLGNVINLVAVSLSAHRTGYRLDWSHYAKAIVIPGMFAVPLYVLNIHWIIGIPVILLVSAFAYARLHIVSKSDILEMSQAFMSEEQVSKMRAFANPIIRFMFGE
jgi:O-antigen/teichoic acid export membrane protein